MFSRLARTQDDALGISRRTAGERSLRRRARTGRAQAARPAAAAWQPGDRDHRTRRSDR